MCNSKLPNVFLVVHNTLGDEYKTELARTNPENSHLVRKHETFKIYSKKTITCVSKGVLKDFKRLFPDHQQCSQIYNPINIEHIRSAGEDEQGKYNDYIVHMGKFKREKRHDILIRVYAKANTDKKLVLVGQGPLEIQYRELVSSLGLTEKVIFTGFYKNPYPIIKNASLLVLSSDLEGLGMLILEAMALGTPVISSDCRSGPSEILPSQNLFPPGDIERLADLLSKPNYSEYHRACSEKFRAEKVVELYLNKTLN